MLDLSIRNDSGDNFATPLVAQDFFRAQLVKRIGLVEVEAAMELSWPDLGRGGGHLGVDARGELQCCLDFNKTYLFD